RGQVARDAAALPGGRAPGVVGGAGAYTRAGRCAASAPGTGAAWARVHRSYQSDSCATCSAEPAGEIRGWAPLAALVDRSCGRSSARGACRDRARGRAAVIGPGADASDRSAAAPGSGGRRRTAGRAACPARCDRGGQRLGVGEGTVWLAAL